MGRERWGGRREEGEGGGRGRGRRGGKGDTYVWYHRMALQSSDGKVVNSCNNQMHTTVAAVPSMVSVIGWENSPAPTLVTAWI